LSPTAKEGGGELGAIGTTTGAACGFGFRVGVWRGMINYDAKKMIELSGDVLGWRRGDIQRYREESEIREGGKNYNG
jgi:hypothetical protein